MDSMLGRKNGSTKARCERAFKSEPFDHIRDLVVGSTTSDHLEKVLNEGGVSANVYLRRLHNYALDMNWLLAPVIAKRAWPRVHHATKRAITLDEHERIIERETNTERKAYYELCWHLGGAQTDMANIRAEDIDWQKRTISYNRKKTGQLSTVCFGEGLETVLRSLPATGKLFPNLARVREVDRATEFRQRCKGLNIEGVTLHSYRYAWAERAMAAGYPERYAQKALGHGSKAVARAYARNADVLLPSLESYERKREQLRRTAIYNEFYRHLSIESQIISTISWEKNSRNYVVLNRTGKDFSERDRNVLTFLTPHIAQAIRNAGIADIMASQLNVLGDGIDAMGRATILVGADGRIHWQSSLAREWLKEFFPGSESARECLPAPVTKWLKQNEQKSPAGKRAFSSLQTPSITKCRLLIYSGKTGCGETVLALIRERLDLDLATGQSYGLTPREAEILYWISEAKTRPEIGAILGISWRTIGKHMERIFAKLGVENRLEAQRIGLELRRV
jgi:DNA-binding CsgD family transcriptional regulator/integrase